MTANKTFQLTIAEKRSTAIAAARSIARLSFGSRHLKDVTADQALEILDDLTYTEPELIAVEWYLSANAHQIALFCREWEQYNRFTQ